MLSTVWDRRANKTLLALLLLIIGLAAIVYYRQAVAIKIVEYVGREQSLQVSCLDFSLDWRLNLSLERACLSTPIAKATIKLAKWQPWGDRLTVDSVKIAHIRSTQTFPKKPTTQPFSLPDSLPKITISSLEFNSYILLKPLNLSVEMASATNLSITGDINATVEMNTDGLIGQLTWQVADLVKYVPQVHNVFQANAKLLQDANIQQTIVMTDFTFDGQSLFSKSSTEIASQINWSVCPIDIKASGYVLVKADLINQSIKVNLSEFANDFNLDNCPILQDYFSPDDLPQLAFSITQPMTISSGVVELSELQVFDQGNKSRHITLTDITYKTSGKINFHYNLLINQPLQAKVIKAQRLDFASRGSVSADLSDKTAIMPFNLSITSDNNHLYLDRLQLDSVKFEKLSSQFSLYPPATNQPIMSGTIGGAGIQMGQLTLAKSTSAITLTGNNFSDLLLNIDSQFEKSQHPDIKIPTITNQLAIKIKQFNQLGFTGETSIKKMSAQQLNFQPITIRHMGQANIHKQTVASHHNVRLEKGFALELEQQQSHVKVQVNQQSITSLQAVISQLVDSALLTKGDMTASLALSLPVQEQPFNASAKVELQQVSGKYQDYLINNANFLMPVTFNSAGLQLTDSTLHIESIDVGVMIQQVRLQLIAKDSLFRLQQGRGEIFDGQFLMQDLWLDGRDQRFNVRFENIDLSQIVALQEQPGIQVTGRINGDLPLVMNKRGIKIEDGWMTSLKGGTLTIKGNPSFDAVKKQQPELALLENLDFSELKSKVKLDPDGWVFFDFSLKGNNPIKKQSVNFNYTHQENIFTLLESIRLVKSVEEKVEQKITQGVKK